MVDENLIHLEQKVVKSRTRLELVATKLAATILDLEIRKQRQRMLLKQTRCPLC